MDDHFSWQRSMGLYKMLESEEGEKEFSHFMFDDLPPISAKQEYLNISIGEVQHVTI